MRMILDKSGSFGLFGAVTLLFCLSQRVEATSFSNMVLLGFVWVIWGQRADQDGCLSVGLPW